VNPSETFSSRTEERSFFSRYSAVIGSFLAILNSGMVIVSFGVFFKPVSAQFDWTRTETSGAFSLATIMSGLVGIAAGKLGDRFNPRLVIVICGAIEGIAYILLSQMNSLWQLYFYYGILVGTGMANVVPATSLVAKMYEKQRGLMSGIAMAGAPLGSAFAPPLATLLISHYNWSASYILIGVLALFIVAVCGFFLFKSADTKHQLKENLQLSQKPLYSPVGSQRSDYFPSKTQEISFKKVIRGWPFWSISLILFCAYFSQQDMIVHIVPHATDLGISPSNAALILTMINGANIMGNYFTGLAVDKISSRLSMVIIMTTLFISSILLFIASSLWVFFIFAILFGIAWGGTSTLRSTMVAELFGLNSHGVITGAVFFISVIGGTISPLLTGYVFDVSGHYHIAFLVIVGLSFLGLIISLILKYQSSNRE
jgi:MFS family permease